MEKVQEIFTPLARISAAAAEVSDAKEIYHLKTEIRDRLIVEAIDEGFEQKDVAAAAGLGSGRIIAILGNAETRRTSNQ